MCFEPSESSPDDFRFAIGEPLVIGMWDHDQVDLIRICLEPILIRSLPKSLALVGREPVPDPHSELFSALDPPNSGGQAGA
jgi:hypothetical protein